MFNISIFSALPQFYPDGYIVPNRPHCSRVAGGVRAVEPQCKPLITTVCSLAP
ncbi:hypothetical protein KAU19_02440 [Candidatus Parcubacteria bacterium]|nr:hypothetical protein [Candidatus Parcubacteria bacterium]